MTLNLVKTTYADLDSTARCALDLRNKPFFFVRCQGILYMNQIMDTTEELVKAIETMWKYDCISNEEIEAEFGTAYTTITRIAGKEAARQAYGAWCEMAEESRQRRAKADALEWIVSRYEAMNDAQWDELYAAGYSPAFVREGLWRAFSQLEKQYPGEPRYRHWIDNSIEAAAVYGFQLGMRFATAGKAVA